jgi:hypothetical protein
VKSTRAKPVSVDAFMQVLDHPHKAGIEHLRLLVKSLDARVTEEVKWNAPSFRLEDHFATFKLYPTKAIELVLHRGAKKKALEAPLQMPEASGLLKWAAPDRCVLHLASSQQLLARESEIRHLLQCWVAQL